MQQYEHMKKGGYILNKRTSSMALCVAVFFQMVGVGLIVALLPSRVIGLSHSMNYVGYLASAFAVSFALFQLPIGQLGDRYGHKRFIVAGYVIACLTGFLYFKTGSVWSILAGRVLQGLAEVPLWSLAPAMLSLLFANSKGEAIGKYNASIHLGLTTGSILSVFVYSVWSGNEAFLLYAVSGLIGALIVFIFVKEPAGRITEKTEVPASYRDLFFALKKIRRPAIHAGIVLYGSVYGVFVSIVPGLLLGEKGFSQSQVGLFFALFYIALSISQVIAGRVTDRRGPNLTIFIGLLLVATAVAPFMWFSGQILFFILSLASFGLGMFCVSAMVLLNDAVPPSLKGSISGVFCLLWGVGYFLAPPLLTKFGIAFGYHAAFLGAAALILVELAALRADSKTNR
jgi:MFS family permease